MKTNKKGISLIVLLITIIVLAILAATVIISIINTGVINSAKDAVEAQKLGQVRDIASVAWGQALIDSDVATPTEYLNYIINFLKGEGYTDEELDKYTIVADVNGVTVNLKDTSEEAPDEPDIPVDTEYAGLTITKDTEGVTFTKADGTTPGDPDNLEKGDIVIYGDYEYRYNWRFELDNDDLFAEPVDGWGVKLRDECLEKSSVGELCGNIYGESLKSMDNTFLNCVNLLKSPAIPITVTYMRGTYCYCEELIEAAILPSTVTDMGFAFQGCSSLEQVPALPSTVTDMGSAFYGCSSLEEAPALPSTVTNLDSTFYGCSSLKQAPVLPSTVTNLKCTFYGCSSLEEAPALPSTVTNLDSTFYGCSSLEEAPALPSNITNLDSTFYGCSSLKQAPDIPENVTDVYGIFNGCVGLNETAILIKSSKVTRFEVWFGSVQVLPQYAITVTIKVPANSTTYTTITSKYGSNSNITIETFEPET